MRPIPYADVILFVLFCGTIMYTFVYQPDNFRPSFVRFMSKFVGEDMILLYKWRELRALRKQDEARAATGETSTA